MAAFTCLYFTKLHRNRLGTIGRTLLLGILWLGIAPCFAQTGAGADVLEVETTGEYQLHAGDEKFLAKKLALFEAKKAAVETAEKYFSHQGLIEFYGAKKPEVVSITATLIAATIQQEDWLPEDPYSRYRVKIRSRIQATDFIKAEIKNLKLAHAESVASLFQELEPQLYATADPGNDIARAYRLYRRKLWRPGLLYVKRLQQRYPHWGEIYLAEAIADYVLHETAFMKEALTKGCDLGARKACEDLQILKRVHRLETDF